VGEAPPVVVAQRLVVCKQLVAAEQELGEVDHAFALAHRVVQGVVLDLAPAELVAGFHHGGTQAFLLRVRDEPLQLPRREAVVVDVVRAVQALDERELVLRVEDLEELRQVGLAVMRAQHAVAQPVERADPHAAGVHRRQRRQTQHHLARGLVGERHREDRLRPGLAGGEQPRDAGGEHARLAAARAGEDQRRRLRQRDRGELLGVEVFEKPGRHRGRP
jgi:hypothetical protein